MTSAPGGRAWADNPLHREWLRAQVDRLLDFFWPAAIDPAGGFRPLDTAGRPRDTPVRDLVQTARMVHCGALAYMMGRPSALGVAEHGLALLRGGLRDVEHGGWYWTVADGNRWTESSRRTGMRSCCSPPVPQSRRAWPPTTFSTR